MDWMGLLVERLRPVPGGVAMNLSTLLPVLVAVAVAVGVPGVWRWLRLGVTLVHELGHALVGVLMGRQFTGFVLRGDMSGHAVTRGPARGAGRVLSTWAGYPMPAMVGAALVWCAGRGWAALVLTASLLVLLACLVKVRSVLTFLVTVLVIAGTWWVWSHRADQVQAQVLTAVGVTLVLGAFRHLAAVVASRDRHSDPAVLASLTHVPIWFWNATFLLVCLACASVVLLALAPSLRSLG